MVRWLLALLALVALGTSDLHMPAMASVPDLAVAGTATADCHASMAGDAATGKAADAASGKAAVPSCCPEGKCDGKCSPVAAIFGGTGRSALTVARTVVAAPVPPALPSSAPQGFDRPPRLPA